MYLLYLFEKRYPSSFPDFCIGVFLGLTDRPKLRKKDFLSHFFILIPMNFLRWSTFGIRIYTYLNLMKDYKLIDPKIIKDNPFHLLDDDWMLVTAGEPDYFNTMTASWGGFGVIWNRPVAIALVRPQRYTRKFIDSYSSYTLCFFAEKYRKALEICGSQSGRNINKIEAAGLTLATTELGNIFFREARLILECKKLYQDDFQEHMFTAQEIPSKFYPSKDFHRFYIGEIINAWKIAEEK